ncbi:MAG: hydantoinase/oxoprolinase family protein [Methanomassiliicoccaceae archaeon]|jgi:N-methylhydantoinase A/oxoprolinase/acetone carboxylase beta subunit|nr:hydantoinase/oxoprolinase family protein [Methanomassiliicoccaceae archaeon]
MIGREGSRTLSLGIDAGGSYTDAVVMDVIERQVIARAKAKTTPEDLMMGMSDVMASLIASRSFNPKDIKFTGLSTTLATNSILEGKGGRVGLIGIGWVPEKDWTFDCVMSSFIDGGHDVRGHSLSALDTEGLIKAAKKMDGMADSMVISSKFSCFNPIHENMARSAVREVMDMPIIAAHELSTDLGIYERTNTAVLNGMLLPVINDFLKDVTIMLSRFKIDSKVMVMKGDGTMMDIASAKIRPVETIMSGPAASAVGGRFLSDLDTCFVIDIGSTSTDIAFLRKGLPPVSAEGAIVGDRRTHVHAMDAYTIALGGDSHIFTDETGKLKIGPRRSVPLSAAALHYPELVKKIREKKRSSFMIPHMSRTSSLSNHSSTILKWIRENAPCTPEEIMDSHPEMYTCKSVIQDLTDRGNVILTGLTPTDILLAKNRFDHGDKAAAKEGIYVEAVKLNMSAEQFSMKVIDKIIVTIGKAVLTKAIMDQTGDSTISKNLSKITEVMTGGSFMDVMNVTAELNIPIVGLGGPAKVFLPALEHRLSAKVILPHDHDVGNAVGTICSKVSETASVQIRATKGGGYELVSSFEPPARIKCLEDALEKAKAMVTDHAMNKAVRAGGAGVTVNVEVDSSNFSNHADAFVDWIEVRARATGDPMGRPFSS